MLSLRLVALILLPTLVAACSREHNYATEREARAAGVFGHDLPDVLPASSKNILVRRKWVPFETSGVFRFDASDRDSFFAKLSASLDAKVWGDSFARTIPTLSMVGVHPLGYDSPVGHWVFFCAAGNGCNTCTWLKR
jgi:hypothetical protein